MVKDLSLEGAVVREPPRVAWCESLSANKAVSWAGNDGQHVMARRRNVF